MSTRFDWYSRWQHTTRRWRHSGDFFFLFSCWIAPKIGKRQSMIDNESIHIPSVHMMAFTIKIKKPFLPPWFYIFPSCRVSRAQTPESDFQENLAVIKFHSGVARALLKDSFPWFFWFAIFYIYEGGRVPAQVSYESIAGTGIVLCVVKFDADLSSLWFSPSVPIDIYNAIELGSECRCIKIGTDDVERRRHHFTAPLKYTDWKRKEERNGNVLLLSAVPVDRLPYCRIPIAALWEWSQLDIAYRSIAMDMTRMCPQKGKMFPTCGQDRGP